MTDFLTNENQKLYRERYKHQPKIDKLDAKISELILTGDMIYLDLASPPLGNNSESISSCVINLLIKLWTNVYDNLCVSIIGDTDSFSVFNKIVVVIEGLVITFTMVGVGVGVGIRIWDFVVTCGIFVGVGVGVTIAWVGVGVGVNVGTGVGVTLTSIL